MSQCECSGDHSITCSKSDIVPPTEARHYPADIISSAMLRTGQRVNLRVGIATLAADGAVQMEFFAEPSTTYTLARRR